MILFFVSLIAGALTVLAPCILPLLPIVVGGSISGGSVDKKRAFTIVASLALSVILFTLLLKVSTLFIEIPQQVWQWISGGVIIALGLVLLLPKLWGGKLLAKVSAESNILLGKGSKRSDIWGNVLIGATLGPVFSTCSPTYFVVLATVLPASPALGMLYLLAYVAGLSVALFVVAVVGQQLMAMFTNFANPSGWLKRGLGALFILVGIVIAFGIDKKIETKLLDAGVFDVTKIERSLLEYVK